MSQHGVECGRRRRAHHFRPLGRHKACNASTQQQQQQNFQIAPREQILDDSKTTVAARHRLDGRLREPAPSLITQTHPSPPLSHSQSGAESRRFREWVDSVVLRMDNHMAVLRALWSTPGTLKLRKRGLSKADMSALQKQMYSPGCEIKGQEDCPICFDAFLVGQAVIDLPCRHRYHRSCVEAWLLNHRRCPYCRTKATTKKGLSRLLSLCRHP